MRDPVPWRVGDVVADLYRVDEVVGRGGMGLVYRVHHLGWAADLAVKSPRPELFADDAARQRFVTEAETWVSLGLNPHVCACHYVRTIDGVPRVFAEYVEGGSLREWIDDRRLYRGTPADVLAGSWTWQSRSRGGWTTPTAAASCTRTSSQATS